jgi:hypothetical protein
MMKEAIIWQKQKQKHAPPFRESISLIISSFKFWTSTILLHAHLLEVYYKYVKFHKNSISGLGGVVLVIFHTPWEIQLHVSVIVYTPRGIQIHFSVIIPPASKAWGYI